MSGGMIEFDYELVQGQRLKQAVGRVPLICDDGSRVFDEIELILEKCSLRFVVDGDTDEVICVKAEGKLESQPVGEPLENVAALSRYLNTEIGWLWVGKNWLGYADMAVLSFAGIEPTVMLVGVASKLNLYRVDKLGAG